LEAIKEKADLIYTRSSYSAFFSLLLGRQTVYEMHYFSDKLISRLFFILARIRKNKLKKIITISNSLRSIVLDKYKINRSAIMVAPDGADPVPASLQLEPCIKNNASDFAIGYIGSLFKGKGMELISEISRKCPWAKFHIIGGRLDDIDYWKRKICDSSNIKFYGYIPHKNVYSYMLSFDALIAPYQEKVSVFSSSKKNRGSGDVSKWMSPLKIFEYMAAGKAILSSDLPVLKEILKHKQNSLLAPPKDIDKWISNLQLIRDDVKLRNELGENAKKEFKINYTWDSRAKKILTSIGIRKKL
jgi:glycosyltransferase involved in cell wall biosynthesis